MEVISSKKREGRTVKYLTAAKLLNRTLLVVSLVVIFLFAGLPVSAHCDSYDGPTVKDAFKALETNNVNLVLKWISKEQEPEVIALFSKTYRLRSGDKEVYSIVEKYFLETLVRLHRETEGAPYTGLKPAGSTKPIIKMSDHAIEIGNLDNLVLNLNKHIGEVIKDKYLKLANAEKIKDTSPEKGREYVAAYVDYTHTLEALHDILEKKETENSGHNH